MLRWCVWIFGAALAAALTLWADGGLGQQPPLSRFDGRYDLVDGAEGVDQAIEEVVGQMGGLVRGIARRRIRQNVRPEASLRIDVRSARHLRIQLGDWRPPSLLLGDTPLSVRGPDGDTTALSARLEGPRLYLEQRSSRGVRETWLSLADDGWHLFQQVRIRSPQLPADIRYTLTYRRARPSERFAGSSSSSSPSSSSSGSVRSDDAISGVASSSSACCSTTRPSE